MSRLICLLPFLIIHSAIVTLCYHLIVMHFDEFGKPGCYCKLACHASILRVLTGFEFMIFIIKNNPSQGNFSPVQSGLFSL